MRDITKFLARFALIGLLNVGGAAAFLAAHEATLDFETWETDSRLLTMPANRHFRAVIIGSSRAHLLGRSSANVQIVEDALGGPVAHLAINLGGGVRLAYYYLAEFYARGNTAEYIIYESAPWVFFSIGPNERHQFVTYEPLHPGFFWRMYRDNYAWDRLQLYVRSKFYPEWLMQRADPLGLVEKYCETMPPNVEKRRNSLYIDGMHPDRLKAYLVYLERIFTLARVHGAYVYLIQFPTLIGTERGQDAFNEALEPLHETYDFDFADFTNSMPELEWYYDTDHMNSAGVARFFNDGVVPWLNSTGTFFPAESR